MRLSEFRSLMADEFGSAYADSVARRHAIRGLESRTADEALRDGVPARTVWLALCDDMEVPADRRLGRDVPTRDTSHD